MRAATAAAGRSAAASATTVALALPLALAIAWFAARPTTYAPAIALTAGLAIAALAWRAPATLLGLLIVWVAALGFVRRVVPEAAVGDANPLVLVAPFGFTMLLAATRGLAPRRTALSLAVGVLAVLVVVGALNPLQGSAEAGAAGLLFVFTPLLGFWVGRALLDDATFARVLKLVAGLALAAAAYGLYQTFGQFPSWDAAWIHDVRRDYRSLNVAGAVRPFSTFSAATEYGFFLAVGIVVWVAYAARLARLPAALAATAFLGVALFYQSSRAAFVVLVIALAAMAAAHWRLRPLTAAVLAAIALAALVATAQYVAPSFQARSSSSLLVEHQVEGLANPLDPESSTVLVHLTLIKDGLSSLRDDPLGIGLGPITIASARYGGVERATEADPSNVAVALGIPGLLAYLAVVVAGLTTAYAIARRRGDVLALAGLGLVFVTFPQWLNGGQYAVAFLPWLALGWFDRQRAAGLPAAPEDEA